MQNSEFEKSVQQQMEELKIVPSGKLWHKIAPKLPAPRKDRRRLILFLLFAVITGSAILTWNNLAPAPEKAATNKAVPVSDTERVTPAVTENKQNENNTTTVNTKTPGTASHFPDDGSTVAGLQGKTIKGRVTAGEDKTTTLPSATQAGLTGTRVRNRYRANQPATTKINVIPSTATTDETLTASATVIPGRKDDAVSKPAVLPTPGATDPSKKTTTNETVKTPADTTDATAQRPAIKNKQDRSAFVYGIHLGAGLSAVKNGLFSDSRVFADAQGYISTGSPGPGSPATPAAPDNPRAAVSFEAGIYFKKQLSSHWALSTGVNYDYQSNSLQIGTKVDSAAVVRFSSDNFKASHFYRTGHSATYRNKFHMLSVPLIVEYRFTNKLPLSATFGPSISYLLQSNSLVYNRALGGYATNENVFKKTLISLNLGAGIDLAKLTRFPIRLGYRFQYGLGSVTNPTFGKQHLLNSTLYLDVPLKK